MPVIDAYPSGGEVSAAAAAAGRVGSGFAAASALGFAAVSAFAFRRFAPIDSISIRVSRLRWPVCLR
jgi:hypothetical protein